MKQSIIWLESIVVRHLSLMKRYGKEDNGDFGSRSASSTISASSKRLRGCAIHRRVVRLREQRGTNYVDRLVVEGVGECNRCRAKALRPREYVTALDFFCSSRISISPTCCVRYLLVDDEALDLNRSENRTAQPIPACHIRKKLRSDPVSRRHS